VVSFTTNAAGNKTSHNIIGRSGNIIATKRYEGEYANKLYIYGKDTRGSVTAVYGGGGKFITGYDYDDFGQTEVLAPVAEDNVQGSAPASEQFYNEVRYTGGIYDESTGLYYLNARYYDPANGRFTTADTYRGDVGSPSTLHLYAYCANDPVNFIDPSGHKWESLYTALNRTALGKSKLEKFKKSQIKLLKKIPSIKCHFERNSKNIGLPKTAQDAVKKKWKRHFGDWAHQTNQKTMTFNYRDKTMNMSMPNTKYIKGHKEVIYYWDGTINNTPEDRGSYNFYPKAGSNNHTLKDVVPWIAWGNSSTAWGNIGSDSTSPGQRRNAYFLQDANEGIKILQELKLYGTIN
jgi:RHS repeat-associated protein